MKILVTIRKTCDHLEKFRLYRYESLIETNNYICKKFCIAIPIKVWSDCNCNYILFTNLFWPGDSEETFRSSESSCHLPTGLPHTVKTLHSPFRWKTWNGEVMKPMFKVFGLTRPGIEPKPTVSAAGVLSIQPLNQTLLTTKNKN